jgi:hypothetical protein
MCGGRRSGWKLNRVWKASSRVKAAARLDLEVFSTCLLECLRRTYTRAVGEVSVEWASSRVPVWDNIG